ncbi:alpha/beta hydrolase fold domain-containing protein [Actinoplanes rectilineatus]|uniref:alpha/beta hydrolase fold domain-containing protein n=1 Tax=Actinoplanes rectilineatus TaxID=113571 RepID=UPI000B270829|nr:alpha/beta hydrolase fold domain-containing protein [Actinoplanes rectilineatus]
MSMDSGYGFHATVTALPGHGDEVVALLNDAPAVPHPDCVTFVVDRSDTDPDTIHVTEGWTSEAAHRAFFGTAPAQALVAALQPLLRVTTRPSYDPELSTLLAGMPAMPDLTASSLDMIRTFADAPPPERPVENIGDTLSIIRPEGAPATNAPCVYWIHGGGMVMGNRWSQIDIPLEWQDRLGAVVVTVDYRLAPEFTGTTAAEDCHRGLTWIAEHATELGIDPERIIVAGASAGGGLAAAVTLMARDRNGPTIAGQILIGPMLDHRNDTVSARQFSGVPAVWTREANAFAWRSLSWYESPALAGDLAGLPATYLDCGSAEVFRDETVTFANRIWTAGGSAELHVWSGGCHGFDALFPDAAIAVAARRTRGDWLARLLSGDKAVRSCG